MKFPILNISIEQWNNNDIDYSIKMLDYHPSINIDKGIKFFIDWFKEYYNV